MQDVTQEENKNTRLGWPPTELTGGLYVDHQGNTYSPQPELEERVEQMRVFEQPPTKELLSCGPGEKELHFVLEDGTRVGISELMRLLNSVVETDPTPEQDVDPLPLPPQTRPEDEIEVGSLQLSPSDHQDTLVVYRDYLHKRIAKLQEKMQPSGEHTKDDPYGEKVIYPEMNLESALAQRQAVKAGVSALEAEVAKDRQILKVKELKLRYAQLKFKWHDGILQQAIDATPAT